MSGMNYNINKDCRVYSDAGLKVKGATRIVRNCLLAFPFLWVSAVRVFIVVDVS